MMHKELGGTVIVILLRQWYHTLCVYKCTSPSIDLLDYAPHDPVYNSSLFNLWSVQCIIVLLRSVDTLWYTG